MNDSPPLFDAPRKSPVDRLRALLEILLISGLVSSALAALPFVLFSGQKADILVRDAIALSLFLLLESGITILLLTNLLKAHRESLSGLGLRWNQWKFNLLIGLALVPALFLINAIVELTFRNYLPQYCMERNPLTEIIHTPQQLALLMVSALIAGGIKEELQRAFILNRFGRYLGGSLVGLVLWSLAFGVAHYVQGVQGIAVAAIYGLVFGITYLLSKSLIAPIMAHSAYDTAALLIYWFFARHY